MPPSNFLDPFNERANDSFFGQLPKHFDTSISIAQYNSFYGGLPEQDGAWQSALPSQKKPSITDKSSSKKKHNHKSTPSRYNQESESSTRSQRRSKSYKDHDEDHGKHIQELPVKTANSKWQTIRHNGDDDGTSRTEALSSDSCYSRSVKSRGKRSESHLNPKRSATTAVQGTPYKKKTFKDYESQTDGDSDHGAKIQLPPAFQLIAKKSKQQDTLRGRSTADVKMNALVQEVRGSMIKKATVATEEGARSKEQRKERDRSTSKRERSLSIGRLNKKKEEVRARKHDHKNEHEEDRLSNSLPSMGYRGHLTDRKYTNYSDDEDQCIVHKSSRTRSRSAGRLENNKKKHREENASKPGHEKEVGEQSSSLSAIRHRRSRELRKDGSGECLEELQRSSSLGPLKKKAQETAGRDRASADKNKGKPERSNSLGSLHKKTTDRAGSAKTNKCQEQSQRNSSLASLHRNGRSLRDQDDACTVTPGERRKAGHPRTSGTSEAPAKVDTASAPNTKTQKKLIVKPAASSMDGIFGSPDAMRKSKKDQTVTHAPINAVHGNKSALAAWKLREASKAESTPVRIRSKASIATAYEAAAGISPRRPSREDHLMTPSLFASPPLATKKKVRGQSSSSPTNKFKMTATDHVEIKTQEATLPPAFRGISCRPKRISSMQNPLGSQTCDGKYIGRDERRWMTETTAATRQSVKASMARYHQ